MCSIILFIYLVATLIIFYVFIRDKTEPAWLQLLAAALWPLALCQLLADFVRKIYQET